MSADALQEVRHAAILLARGLCLGFAAGVMWGVPDLHSFLWVIAALGIVPLLFAISAMAIAALTLRNVIGRALDLHGRILLIHALQGLILLGFLAIMVAMFLTGSRLIAALTGFA